MKPNKKADDLMFWARQFSFSGNGKFSARKELECQIYHAKQISMCTVGEIEKVLKSSYKKRGESYKGSVEQKYWKEVFKCIKGWEIE